MLQKIQTITNNKKLSTALLLISVFLCYTGMYAIRKSFLAGQYKDLDLGYGIDAKTILVISQVMGYMISKFAGIKVISEMKKEKRAIWLVILITFGLLMLGVFAIAPPKLKVLALFLNGLPLGMIFGLVFSYIEGRKNTELLAAALSATFIFSTGFVKTVGLVLMQNFHVSEYNMPFLTGLVFFPLFLLSVFVLNKSKGPSESDVEERTKRVPMYKAERKAFIAQNGFGYFGLVAIYVLLTIVRDFRDNFMVEFWSEHGFKGAPQIVTLTEIPVAVTVLIIAAAGVLIRKNKIAFNTGVLLTALGAIIVIFSTALFEKNILSPVIWMITSGIGIYLPYILFHCLLFERLVALLSFKGNVGFLFYIADAVGYLGSVTVLFLKEIIGFKQSWTAFFIRLNLQSAAVILLFAIFIMWYFNRRFARKKADATLIFS
jgi:MFS family permease